MTFSEALDWLYSTQQFGIKLGLENTRRLLDALDQPQDSCRFLHVAGTNGKGSICAMMDSVLRAGGYRTGLYTSPHLVDFRERIRVNGEWISKEAVAKILSRLKDASQGWEHSPTFFELATVLAIRHFANSGTDYVILETGMGGRLDATNTVTPLVSVISSISMDHAKWLGDTLASVAAEKAGIFKTNVPVVSSPQRDEVAVVLRERAKIVESPLEFVDGKLPGHWTVALEGEHQRVNACTAVAALNAAGIALDDEAVTRGLAEVSWPGRFQRIGSFILDGAHNPDASAKLVETWRRRFGDQKAVVIFGALADKDFPNMLAAIGRIAEEIWLVPVDSARSTRVEELAEVSPSPATKFLSLPSALKHAEELDRPILVTGSLFLVGEALKYLRPREGG